MKKPAALFIIPVLLAVLVATLVLAMSPPSDSGEPVFDKIQQHKVIEVDARHLQALKGKTLDTLSLYAVHDGKLVPVPFQFEEFEHKDIASPESFSQDKKIKGIFDNHDLLVFMLKDSGPQAVKKQLETLELISALKLQDQDTVSYVYLIENGKKNPTSYVDYDQQTGVITMPCATIQMNPKDLLDWGDVIPLNNGAENEASLLDCLKLRINGRLLNFRLKLNNNNLQARLKKIHEGPVRLTLDAEIRAVIAKIPLIKADAQLHIDSSSARLFIDMDIPAQYSRLIKDPVVLIGVDGYDLYGKILRTSITGSTSYPVDGKMDINEKALNKRQVTDPISWLWLSDDNDLNLIGQYDLSANDNYHPDDFPEITILYVDDEDRIDKPERFPGSVPTIGYRLDGIPKSDNVRMSYKVLIIRDLKSLSAGDFLAGLDRKIAITVLQ